jgi:hypothetical protein
MVAAIGLVGCGNGGTTADDTAISPTSAVPHRFSMTLSSTQLKPGAEFFVTYHADNPDTVIQHGDDLALSREGKWLYALYNIEDPENDELAVGPPGEPVTAVPFTGPGPYRFVLPKDLDPETYRICGGLWAGGTSPRVGSEQVCVDITV